VPQLIKKREVLLDGSEDLILSLYTKGMSVRDIQLHLDDLFGYVPSLAVRLTTIFYLPPYSPHLNIIETLWRFMKHVWIDYRAYLSIDNLRNYIKNIFIYYGIFYIIDFGGIL
jgi:hypothetical protein